MSEWCLTVSACGVCGVVCVELCRSITWCGPCGACRGVDTQIQRNCIYMISPSHLSQWYMCDSVLVLCHVCQSVVSGHIVTHQVSPSQLWSGVVWSGVEWCGVVHSCVEWCDTPCGACRVVWCGVHDSALRCVCGLSGGMFGVLLSLCTTRSKPNQPLLSDNSVVWCTCVPLGVVWSGVELCSLVFPLAHRSMRISVVCNFLSSFFLTGVVWCTMWSGVEWCRVV